MQSLNVIVANGDQLAASRLVASLHTHFRDVAVARSLDEVRSGIPKHGANLAIVDLETVPLTEVRRLCHDFGQTSVVVTHRLPDEEMWADALAAGAIDCCQSVDANAIVQAVDRNLRSTRGHAA